MNIIYYIFSLEARYFLTATNELCAEHDDIAVDNLSTCKEAAEELKLNFLRAENIGNYPKGCYESKGLRRAAGNVFFNQHSTGSRQSNARQICKAIG